MNMVIDAGTAMNPFLIVLDFEEWIIALTVDCCQENQWCLFKDSKPPQPIILNRVALQDL